MPQYAVYNEAVRLVGFDRIKDAFLAGLDGSPDFTTEMKLAIKLAAEKLPQYPGSDFNTFDGPLLGILYMPWESVGATGMAPLTTEQRDAILQGVLAVCKAMVNAESLRLQGIAGLDMALPADWAG